MSQYPAPRYAQQVYRPKVPPSPPAVVRQSPKPAVSPLYIPQLGQEKTTYIFMPDSKPTFYVSQHFAQAATPALPPKKTFKKPSITLTISVSLVPIVAFFMIFMSMILGHAGVTIGASSQQNSTIQTQDTTQQVAQTCSGLQPGCHYKVRPGDSLYTLAQGAYGVNHGALWKKIYNANKKKIKIVNNVYIIHPGDTLYIPT